MKSHYISPRLIVSDTLNHIIVVQCGEGFRIDIWRLFSIGNYNTSHNKYTSMMTSSNGDIFHVTDLLCGEFTGPGEFPAQRPMTRSFDIFFDLCLNERLSELSWGWWFETPSWRHCNGLAVVNACTPITTVVQRFYNLSVPIHALKLMALSSLCQENKHSESALHINWQKYTKNMNANSFNNFQMEYD